MKSFEQLVTNPLIQKAIDEMGFKEPTPIQAETLPLLLGEPTDLIALAATGTGKTAAFGIPLLNRIDPHQRAIQGLILCPTRELAVQVSGQINLLGKYLKLRSVAVYGGSSYLDQIHGMKTANIVVATPGRLVDHLTRKNVSLSSVRTVILDEADEMISMGFKEDLEAILKASENEQGERWLFSATMSPEIKRMADRFLDQPKFIQMNRSEVLSNTVEQLFFATREGNKPEILCKIIEAADSFYGIIFCQTKNLVVDLTRYLTERGYKVDCLHGDKDQRSREDTIRAFRERRVKILICTDVASRGLDVKDVTHVINYSIPRELESYVHRIGRTARSGKNGIAMSLVTPSHRHLIPRLEKITRSKIKEGVLPTRKDIGLKKLGSILIDFKAKENFGRAQALLSDDWKVMLSTMGAEEIAARFIAMSFPDLFEEKERVPVSLGAAKPREQAPWKNETGSLKKDRKPAPWMRHRRSEKKFKGRGQARDKSRG